MYVYTHHNVICIRITSHFLILKKLKLYFVQFLRSHYIFRLILSNYSTRIISHIKITDYQNKKYILIN